MAFQYKMRSKEQWEARANSGGGDFESWLKDEYRSFTPIAGENCVRILPPSPLWDNPPHYGMDVWVHYGVGPDKASVICLFRMRKGNCPICEERARQERAGDDEMARELRATKRTLVFIINRKDEGQGMLAWGMAKTLDDAIVKIARDRATGEFYFIDDPTDGYDIYFDKTGERLMTKYTGAALAKRSSPVPQQALDWLETHSVPDALRWRSYEEVQRLFVGAGRGEAPDEAPSRPRGRGDDRVVNINDRQREPERESRPERSERSERSSERAESPPAEDNDDPPFDTGPAEQAPERPAERTAAPPKASERPTVSSDGKARAEQLRARFGLPS